MQPSPALHSCRIFLLLLHLILLISAFPFAVPTTSALPGDRTASAPQAAHRKKHLSPQLSSSNSQVAGAQLSWGIPECWGAPRVCHGMGQRWKTVQARSGLHSFPKRARVIFGIFSRTIIAKVLFLKLYCNPRVGWEWKQLLHRNSYSCLLIPSTWFYILPGLSVVRVCVCSLSSRSICSILHSKEGKLMPS